MLFLTRDGVMSVRVIVRLNLAAFLALLLCACTPQRGSGGKASKAGVCSAAEAAAGTCNQTPTLSIIYITKR